MTSAALRDVRPSRSALLAGQTGQHIIQLCAKPLARGYPLHAGIPHRFIVQDKAEATPASILPDHETPPMRREWRDGGGPRWDPRDALVGQDGKYDCGHGQTAGTEERDQGHG